MNEGKHLDSLDPLEETNPTGSSNRASNGGARYTRIAATIVLLVASPMLLLSGSALALFYASPDRFNNILARLPGEAAIRTMLIFAPAALLAIIVLALLYAIEPPTLEITRPQPVPKAGTITSEIGWLTYERRVSISSWLLLLTIPVTLLIVSVRSASFLSPAQFDNFIGRIPGGSLLEFFIGAGFILLLAAGLVGLIVFSGLNVGERGEDRRFSLKVRSWLERIGPERLAVGTVLLFSLPMLILSLLGLTGFLARPSRVLDLLTQLPKEVILRLGLLFLPSSLFIVVVLAVLFLPRRLLTEGARERLFRPAGSHIDRFFQYLVSYGSWILYGGLTVALAVVLGLVVGVIVLLLR
jgi:hypothetical protein